MTRREYDPDGWGLVTVVEAVASVIVLVALFFGAPLLVWMAFYASQH